MEHYDVVILGGGLVGAVTGLLLHQKGMHVAIVEKNSLKEDTLPKDGRTTAISYGSKEILDRAGVWGKLLKNIHPIHEIKVFEAETPFTLNFLEEDKKHIPHDGPLAFMIDNAVLRMELQKALKCTNLDIYDETEVQRFLDYPAYQELTLTSSQKLTATLILSCEGRNAPSREHFGITTKTFDYKQTAVVGALTHTTPHMGIAYEVFHPKGPMAFLPLPDREDGSPQSALVWSATEDVRDMSDQDILERIASRFPYLGQFIELKGKQFYPLKGQRTSKIIGSRYILLGDAAHVLHPVAGQGVNLGWRDGDQVVKLIQHAKNCGIDFGGDAFLKSYEKKRLMDQRKIFFISDSMIRLFGIDHPFVQMVRSYGLGLVNRISPLKRFLIKQAMGRS